MDILDNLPEEYKADVEKLLNNYKTQAEQERNEKDKINQNKQEILDQMKKYKQQFDGVDPEEYKKLKEQMENDKYKEVFDQYGIEGIEKAIAEREGSKYQSAIKEQEDKYNEALKEKETIQEQLESIRMENDISKVVSKMSDKLGTNAHELIELIVQRDFQRSEQGELVRKDGKVNNLGQPMTLEDWLNNKETMQNYPSFYQGKSGSGFNGGGNLNGETTKMTGEDFKAHISKFGPAEKAKEINRLKKEGLI